MDPTLLAALAAHNALLTRRAPRDATAVSDPPPSQSLMAQVSAAIPQPLMPKPGFRQLPSGQWVNQDFHQMNMATMPSWIGGKAGALTATEKQALTAALRAMSGDAAGAPELGRLLSPTGGIPDIVTRTRGLLSNFRTGAPR